MRSIKPMGYAKARLAHGWASVHLFINPKKEVALYFLKAKVICLLAIGIPCFVLGTIAANVVLPVIFTLSLAETSLCDLYAVTIKGIENCVAHGDALSHLRFIKNEMSATSGNEAKPPDSVVF